MNNIEVCFSPALYSEYANNENIVVVSDILRATSAICSAFMNGVNSIIPVATVIEAIQFKQKGYLVAAERDGFKLDFADFGNSPFNFSKEKITGKDVVYSTTNGTQVIKMASHSFKVVVGSYLNLTALAEWLVSEKRDVLLFCAGWKNKFSLEDTIFTGALAEKILESGQFITRCDSCNAAIDLWKLAKPNLVGYIQKAAQRDRLRTNGLDDVIEYCHSFDLTTIIPVLEKNKLIRLKTN